MAESKLPGKSSGAPRSGKGAFRLFGRNVDRLSVRLALGVSLIVIGPLLVGFYALSRHHFDQAVAAQQRSAELQTRLLEMALRHVMLDQDPELLRRILQEISNDPAVLNALILDHRGVIRASSDPAAVGQRITVDSPECSVCHAKDPDARGRWTLLHRGELAVLRSVLPIENRSECHACHDAREKLNGMLVLDTSMAQLERELVADTRWFIAGAALLALLLLGGIAALVRFLILKRLARLRRTARAIAAGDLSQRVQLRGDDVIAALGADFNDMTRNVDRLIHEVRDQEAQLESVMNSLDDGLVVLDDESRIIACNHSFGRRLGRVPETVHGRACAQACGGVLPCCTSAAECPAARCRSSGQVQRAVFRSRSDDGELVSVEEVYASPIFDEEGRVVRVVEIWRDISEQVREEEHMAEIERLVSLGTLASGFSHEVNTPLATMLTCAESVVGRLDSDTAPKSESLAAIRDNALIIRDQVLRCRRITDQFLRFSRGIPPSVEPIDLPELVATVVALVAPTAREKGIELRQIRDGPLPAVRANTEVVQHVVLNLLVNAVQSFENRRGSGSIEISLCADDRVRLRVRDEGCGIDPARRRHLFEPFRSQKPGGTGLGLYLSRSFMRRFGGDVRLVDSHVGSGSCFEVVFAAPNQVA